MKQRPTNARGRYIVGIDGDAVLDYHALDYIVQTLKPTPCSAP